MTTRRGSLELPPTADSVGRARAAVRDVGAGLPREVLADAELLVSELMSNAVRHGGGGIRLTVSLQRGSLTVAVFDAGPERPAMRTKAPERTVASGRGLRMVEQLAADWGVDAADSGKTVWFRLVAAPAQEEQPRHPGRINKREDRAAWSSSSRGARTRPETAR